jgi:hypothetical protein
MKINFVFIIGLLFFACKPEEAPVSETITIEFQHRWGSQSITAEDLESTVFPLSATNGISITRLRYLISEIVLVRKNGEEQLLKDYHLVALNSSESLVLQTQEQFPLGDYTQLRFRFGFQKSKNAEGAYPDLNAASWNVPAQLGGGYHYLQLDGKYGPSDRSAAQPFNFHMIAAADISGVEPRVEDTSFLVDLGPVTLSAAGRFTLVMDVSKWFKDPILWDFDQWSINLMPNFEAQQAMHQNGKNVFQLQQ